MKDFSKKYLDLLQGEFSTINLTRIENEDEFYNKQILDSIIPLEKSKTFKAKIEELGIMLDIGFGGGFPVVPLAHINPKVKFFGFDARGKKADVVTTICERLGVQNTKLFHQRFEEVEFDKDIVITFKAVGKISELLQMFTTTATLYVYFYKGPNYRELEDLGPILKNWELFEEIEYGLDGAEGRTFLAFKNKNVLRGTNTAKKIKFSSLL